MAELTEQQKAQVEVQLRSLLGLGEQETIDLGALTKKFDQRAEVLESKVESLKQPRGLGDTTRMDNPDDVQAIGIIPKDIKDLLYPPHYLEYNELRRPAGYVGPCRVFPIHERASVKGFEHAKRFAPIQELRYLCAVESYLTDLAILGGELDSCDDATFRTTTRNALNGTIKRLRERRTYLEWEGQSLLPGASHLTKVSAAVAKAQLESQRVLAVSDPDMAHIASLVNQKAVEVILKAETNALMNPHSDKAKNPKNSRAKNKSSSTQKPPAGAGGTE